MTTCENCGSEVITARLAQAEGEPVELVLRLRGQREGNVETTEITDDGIEVVIVHDQQPLASQGLLLHVHPCKAAASRHALSPF